MTAICPPRGIQRLAEVAPELELILTQGSDAPTLFAASQIRREVVWVTMRDGVRLATDLYLPPSCPAPAIAMRTPYGRGAFPQGLLALAQCGYAVISQDCRGTGDSGPRSWDMFIYEREDGVDLVEWVSRQEWFDGFLGSLGGSYTAATQWAMAMHPRMSAIAPEVGGLCVQMPSVRYYMFVNAFSRTVGKGSDKPSISYVDMEREMLKETLAGGYFNEPLRTSFRDELLEQYPDLLTLSPHQGKRWLWEHFCVLGPAQRAGLIKLVLGTDRIAYEEIWAFRFVFDHRSIPGWVVLPSPCEVALARSLQAPALVITGWYDWGLADTLASWELLAREASQSVRSRSRLLITPNAHNMPGYHEQKEVHSQQNHRQGILDLRMRWYAALRDGTIDSWPTAMYFLMGANEWYGASAWPPPEARICALYLGTGGALTSKAPERASDADRYTYDPNNPTPTVGGNIVSYVYPPGSVDVSEVQQRPDVLVYNTARLDQDLDVVGPLRLILYASSSAVDTDFSARLSDVFPDGRAIQLQAGILRARYCDPHGEPELLEPGRIYRFEIDMWATANRFTAGHRLRLDISSADFPRFDRNTNRGGEPGPPIPAVQAIYHDPEHPSHLLMSVIGGYNGNR